MYEALDAVAADLGQIKMLVADRDAGARVQSIRVALEQTARRISDRSAATDDERDQFGRLYRGMLAAARITRQLREHHHGPEA